MFVSIVLSYALFVRKCVLNHFHRVSTQLQLTNISYHIKITSSICMRRYDTLLSCSVLP